MSANPLPVVKIKIKSLDQYFSLWATFDMLIGLSKIMIVGWNVKIGSLVNMANQLFF